MCVPSRGNSQWKGPGGPAAQETARGLWLEWRDWHCRGREVGAGRRAGAGCWEGLGGPLGELSATGGVRWDLGSGRIPPGCCCREATVRAQAGQRQLRDWEKQGRFWVARLGSTPGGWKCPLPGMGKGRKGCWGGHADRAAGERARQGGDSGRPILELCESQGASVDGSEDKWPLAAGGLPQARAEGCHRGWSFWVPGKEVIPGRQPQAGSLGPAARAPGGLGTGAAVASAPRRRGGPRPPPPALAPRRVLPSPLATCGVGQIRAFVPRPGPAAPRGAPRANTAERRGSRAAPTPQISGPQGGGLAGQLRPAGGCCAPAGAPPSAAGRALSCRWPAGGALRPGSWEGGSLSQISQAGGRPSSSSRPEPVSLMLGDLLTMLSFSGPVAYLAFQGPGG